MHHLTVAVRFTHPNSGCFPFKSPLLPFRRASTSLGCSTSAAFADATSECVCLRPDEPRPFDIRLPSRRKTVLGQGGAAMRTGLLQSGRRDTVVSKHAAAYATAREEHARA